MPPHSEQVDEIPYVEVENRLRRRRKRSRSTSPFFLRRPAKEREYNNNNNVLAKSGSNSSLSISSRSSRSSSVSSEFRVSFSISAIEPYATRYRELARKNSDKSHVSQSGNSQIIVDYHEAPDFLQFNPFIVRGYRTNLCPVTCLKSLFWWTNETLNAWTHLLGWLYFAYFTVQEVLQAIDFEGVSSWQDRAITIMILVCFQVCMAMSAGYHTFCCRSRDSYHCWLSYDLCGISFSLLAIYTTGIYYAFWCQDTTRNIYIAISSTLFIGALIFQTTPKFLADEYNTLRVLLFVSWSSFGFLPSLHWAFQNGGFGVQHVFDLVSQIGIMYLICGAALFFYITKIPEIWFPGWVCYVGSSHQWWHVIIFLAFRHWHTAGKYFAEFRSHHGCFEQSLNRTLLDSGSEFTSLF